MYTLDTDIRTGMPYAEALKKAITMEEKIISFYIESARQSESLVADLPRAFKVLASTRKGRIEKLTALLSGS